LFDFLTQSYAKISNLDRAQVVDFVVNAPQHYTIWWKSLLKDAPEHIVIETFLVLFIIWLMFIRRTVDPNKASKNQKLSKQEEQWLMDTWEPEPLGFAPATEKEGVLHDSIMVIDSVNGNYLKIRGVAEAVLNVASYDFLGMSQESAVKASAKKALEFYGCGSCGPRGFYGTIDLHLNFEAAVAKFMGVEEAISYSDGASAVSSVIPAFAKKGDLLLVDEAVSEPVLCGLNLSRATVQFFKHNDMEDLRVILESISADDKRLKRDTSQQRRFIVVEGLYRNTGDICPLLQLLALKEKHCYRIILDESLSFGVIGATGRGVTEYFGVSINTVEIVVLAMDAALASVGGVCIGKQDICDHQRLSGAGYCFSASAPPFLSACAITALALMEAEPERLEKLHACARYLHTVLRSVKGVAMKVDYHMPTPVVHLVLKQPLDCLQKEATTILRIARCCVEGGVGITASKFSMSQPASYNRPSLTLNASTKMTEAEMDKIGAVLAKAVKQCTA